MKIVRIIVPLAFVVVLIGYTNKLRHVMNEGGWSELAIALICFGGILMCYGVALMPITSKVRAVATYVTNDVAPMKKPRGVPLRYRIAALIWGRCRYSCSAWSLLWCDKRIAAHQIQLGLGGRWRRLSPWSLQRVLFLL